jgi:hypothetical protein
MSARAWTARIVLSVVAIAAYLPARALAEAAPAPILTIVEIDQGHDSHTLGEDAVVDINSVLKIKIDRDALRARAAEELGGEGGSTSESLPKLQKILGLAEEGTKQVPLLVAATKTLSQGGNEAARVAAFETALKPLAKAFGALIKLIGRDDPLYDQLNVALNDVTERSSDEESPTAIVDQYAALFAAAAAYARPLVEALARELTSQGVYVQIGGWLGDNPVHLEGLDSYAPSARYEVARFATPTPEQQKQYAELEKRIKTLDRDSKRVFALMVDQAIAVFEPAIEPVKLCVTGVADDGKALVEDARATAAVEVEELRGQLAPVLDLARFVAELVKKYRAATPDLATLRDDLTLLVAKVRAAVDAVAAVPASLNKLVKKAAAFKPRVEALALKVKDCGEKMKLAATQTLDKLLSTVSGADAQRQLNDEMLRFGDQVHKFLLADVPTKSELDLTTAGKRAAGDRVVIKVGIGRPGEEARMIESHHIDLFQVLLHVDVNVSLVFLHPTNDDKPTDPQVKLQPAPSYSLVAKPFSCFRNYPGYYRFIDFGIGVNIAAPDFDQDETPEFAAGVVVTLFRDFVQGGIGYNFGDRQPYLFFGLRLPYASATVATP